MLNLTTCLELDLCKEAPVYIFADKDNGVLIKGKILSQHVVDTSDLFYL